MTSTTRTAASARVTQTFSIARLMNSDLVGADDDLHALGQGRLRAPRRPALAASATASVLAPGLADDAEADRRLAVEPEGGIGIFRRPARPGRRRRAGRDSRPRRGRRRAGRTAAASANGRSTRRVTFCWADSSRPAGSSTFWRRSAVLDVAGRQAEGGEPLRAAATPASPAAPRRRRRPGRRRRSRRSGRAGCGRHSR